MVSDAVRVGWEFCIQCFINRVVIYDCLISLRSQARWRCRSGNQGRAAGQVLAAA